MMVNRTTGQSSVFLPYEHDPLSFMLKLLHETIKFCYCKQQTPDYMLCYSLNLPATISGLLGGSLKMRRASIEKKKCTCLQSKVAVEWVNREM